MIVLGKHDGKNVNLDLDALLRGRMLIQANSGKGKSWLLRRLAEQLFSRVQVIIIDPEGEFSTLREKYGYVLVGKGGETPADPRSAALVAHKLLELRASAVCDLYEMKPFARHEWVQRFIDAMIDAPKNLWHPCVVMVDEAHVYCPEKGSGESIAAESVISLGTRGRKRGFCIIAATQRLGKLRKDLAAELLNVMIGGTFIDIDRKRAADALGVYGAEQHKFFDEIKLLERGHFYALGPAISNERIMVDIGPVDTSHPEAGSSKHASEPPPPPEAIAKLLPKLSDLPREAEEKAKTEAELRREIRELKAQVRTASTQKVQPSAAKPVVDSLLIKKAVTAAHGQYRQLLTTMRHNLSATLKEATHLAERMDRSIAIIDLKLEEKIPAGEISTKGTRYVSGGQENESQRDTSALPVQHPRPVHIPTSNGHSDLGRPQTRVLRALAEFEAIGVSEPSRSMVASWCGVKAGTGTFKNYLSELRVAGYLRDGRDDRLLLTDEGRGLVPSIAAPVTAEELLERSASIFGSTSAKILRIIHRAHPEFVKREAIAEELGISADTGTFKNYLSKLRTAGMIEDGSERTVKAADWLFLEGQ